MNQENPYASPMVSSQPEVDPKLMRAVASHFASTRKNPPTITNRLLKWPGTPLLVLYGVVGTAIFSLPALTGDFDSTFYWPLCFAAMIFGAVIRDYQVARLVKKLWKPQSHFIDWKKVDEYT